MIRIDIYDMIVGDVFIEVSPWIGRSKTYEVTEFDGRDVLARSSDTKEIERFSYSKGFAVYGPRVYLVEPQVDDDADTIPCNGTNPYDEPAISWTCGTTEDSKKRTYH